MRIKTDILESTTEKVSRVLSEKYGVKVIFQGAECKTDGSVIYLPSLPDDVPEEMLPALKGWADHETSHILFTGNDVGREFTQKHGARAFSLLNSLEDARVEHLMAEKYPGSGINIDRAVKYITDAAEGRKTPSDPLRSLSSALYTRASGREDFGYIPPAAYTFCDMCEDEISRLHKCKNTREVAELTESVLKKLQDAFKPEEGEEEEEEENEPRDEQAGSGQAAEGDPDQAGEETKPAPCGEKEDSENSGSSEDGKEEKDASGESEAGEGQACGSEGARGASGSPCCEESDEDRGTPMDEIKRRIERCAKPEGASQAYRVYTREYDMAQAPATDPGYGWRDDLSSLRPQVSGLMRRLVHTLKGREEKRWLRGRPRGKLDPGALHKLAAEKSSRVFRKRTETHEGHSACTLLLDLSASMRGKQLQLCRKLALIFGETLARLDFPTEIIGFSTCDRDIRYEIHRQTGIDERTLARTYSRMVPLYHGIYKSFDEPWSRGASRMGDMRAKALTPLGESLLFAGKRLAQRPERRKVLFCLTDGEPVTGAWDESVTMQHACDVVKKLTTAGIEPIGLGLMENCVENIFPRHAVIWDLAQLPTTFGRQLCDVLTERRASV